MKTLPDYLSNNLEIISIGLNPSLPSVAAGFYFANPRNRFWRALNASRLVEAPLEPGVPAVETLFKKYRMGFTDVVKRPSANASKLTAADYREWTPLLREKLLQHQPRIAWFHGKIAYANYLKYAEQKKPHINWGRQRAAIGDAVCYVTPNPSPANAAFSLQELTRWYNKLAALRYSLRD